MILDISSMFTTLHTSLLAASALVVPFSSANAPGCGLWFDLGHRIVGDIAMMRLKPHTLAAARDLLGGQSLQDASIWADRIRGHRRNTSPLHYVNIPLTAQGYVPARDCPRGQCIIAAIDSFTRVLGDSNKSRLLRAEALRFLLHLVGDLHQPLHVADNNDKGGNRTQVRFDGRGTNLHKLWDGELIEHTGVSEAQYLQRLRTIMDSVPVAKFEVGTVVDWAMEGHRIARDLAYRLPSNRKLDTKYVNSSLRQVDPALVKAGVRLAHLLNTALVGYQPSLQSSGRPLGPGVYSDEEAAAHVGELATVVGHGCEC
jgi:nuclease S1